jgi:hypothetical protein
MHKKGLIIVNILDISKRITGGITGNREKDFRKHGKKAIIK